mgnify:FL=1
MAKTDREFEEENKQLRKQLRDMNNLLNGILLRQDITKLVPKRLAFKDKSVEDRVRTYNQEIQNNKKIMKTKNEEYQILKLRIEQIKDPKYPIKLKEKIIQTKERIDQIRKENKQLEFECKTAGKSIHKVESAAGIPQSLQTANERAREAALLEDKNEQLAAVVGAFEEQHAEQLKTIEQLNFKISKLEELAKYYQVPIDKNPLREKYYKLSKEIKEYEEGIQTMLKRNDKIMQNFFENELEGLQYNLDRDKEYLANVEDMIQKQVVALKELLARESLADHSMKELFGKVQSALDENKLKKEEEEAKAQKEAKKEQQKAKRPPMGKYMSERDELYKDLPLFSPHRDSQKKFAIRKVGKVRAGAKKQNHGEKEIQKISEEDENLQTQPESEVKQPVGERNNKERLVLNHEPKKEEPVGKKTEVNEEKKPFGKPFGVKKYTNKSGNESTGTDSYGKAEDEWNKNTKETSSFKTGKLAEKSESDLNYVHGEGLKLSGDGNQSLQLLDSNNTKELTLDGSQKNENKELKLNGVQDSIHEELPTEDFGIGGSRLNRHRTLKKDNKNDSELNLNGGLQLNGGYKANEGLKLNDGFTSSKAENKDFKLGQKSGADEDGIRDPFAKYDDLSNLDFSKKKNIALHEDEGEKRFTDKKEGLFGEKKESVFGDKKETLFSYKNSEPKPFTLETKQPQFKLGNGGDSSLQNNIKNEGKTFKVYEDDGPKKESLGLNFGEKTKTNKDDGLNFLNDGAEKKSSGFTLETEEKKPRRMIVKRPENDLYSVFNFYSPIS